MTATGPPKEGPEERYMMLWGRMIDAEKALRSAEAGDARSLVPNTWQLPRRSPDGAELILAVEHKGLGFLLATGRDFADVAQVVAVMAVMVMIGMMADRWIFAKLQAAVHRRFGLA